MSHSGSNSTGSSGEIACFRVEFAAWYEDPNSPLPLTAKHVTLYHVVAARHTNDLKLETIWGYNCVESSSPASINLAA
jgi:hypothetical protein